MEHVCTQCSYKTKRRYNLERHLATVHFEDEEHKCPHCYVILSCLRKLKDHLKVCKSVEDPYQCHKCRKVLASYASKSRHLKTCKSQDLVLCSDPASSSVSNINTQNNIQNNIQTQNNVDNSITNNIVVLKFPDCDDEFDFIRDHITTKEFQRLFDVSRPEIGFRRFAAAVINKKENRIVKKIDAKANHSMIHTGDGEWELALDKDVFPRLTFDLSVSALGAFNDNKKKARLVKTNMDRIFAYLDAVNTENDEEYSDAVQRLKLIIVNLTKKWETEVV